MFVVQKALFNQRIGRRNVSPIFKDLQELRLFALEEKVNPANGYTLCGNQTAEQARTKNATKKPVKKISSLALCGLLIVQYDTVFSLHAN